MTDRVTGVLRPDAAANALLSPAAEATVTRPGGFATPRTATGAGVLCAALGFCCFIPYPALAVGNRTGVQIGSVLTVLMVWPVLLVPWSRRWLWLYPALLAPLSLSALRVGLTGEGDVALSLKMVAAWMLVSLTMVAIQLHAARFALELLTGIAAATLLHAAVGCLQLYSFARGEFPLAWLYVNPAFLSVQDNADVIAQYTRRPFGLFPEPSAMSASLAPWVIFWTACLFGVVRLRRTPAAWQRTLFGAAAAGALALMILSQSGHTAIALAAMSPLAALWFVRLRATARSILGLLAFCGILLPAVLCLATFSLANRLGGSTLGNSSWEDRAASMRIGLELVSQGGPATIVFGMGPGLSAPAIQNNAGLEAVWSILLTYVYETGLIGALVLCWIGAQLLRLWRSIRYDTAFAAVLGAWFVGVTVTTSYTDLLPVWVTLAWLTVWPEVCQADPRGQPVGAARARSAPANPADDLAAAPEMSTA